MTTLTKEEFRDLGVIAVANLFNKLYVRDLLSKSTLLAKGLIEEFTDPAGVKLTDAGIRAFERGVKHYGQLVEHRVKTGGREETTW